LAAFPYFDSPIALILEGALRFFTPALGTFTRLLSE
jgi:hypothetical protein